jgi:hypothetical protein
VKSVDRPPQTIEELRTELALAERYIVRLEANLTAEQLARQKDAEKRREREQALTNELRMMQKGVKTGCVCPAGKCMKLTANGEMCWAEWAGLKAVRDVAQTQLDGLVRDASHPKRLTIEGG